MSLGDQGHPSTLMTGMDDCAPPIQSSDTCEHLQSPQLLHQGQTACRAQTGHSRGNVTRGPGRPPYVWTTQRADAFLRLLIKTSLSFDDILAALVDPETGVGPGKHVCRKLWQSIFGDQLPDVARLKYPKGKAQREKDHREAYIAYRQAKQAQADMNGAVSNLPDSGVPMLPPPCGSIGNGNRYQSLRPVSQLSTPLGTSARFDSARYATMPSMLAEPYLGPDESSPLSIISSSDDDSRGFQASQLQIPAHTTGAEKASFGVSVHKRKLQNRCQIEERNRMVQGQLDWYINTRRTSFVSRLSKRSSADSAEAHLFSHSDCEDREFNAAIQLLDDARRARDIAWPGLGEKIRQALASGANPNKPNAEGIFPLHMALELGCVPAVCALLEHGADPKVRTSDKISLSDYARWYARAFDLPMEVQAHIEWASEIVKYDPELKNVLLNRYSRKSLKRRHSDPSCALRRSSLDSQESVTPGVCSVEDAGSAEEGSNGFLFFTEPTCPFMYSKTNGDSPEMDGKASACLVNDRQHCNNAHEHGEQAWPSSKYDTSGTLYTKNPAKTPDSETQPHERNIRPACQERKTGNILLREPGNQRSAIDRMSSIFRLNQIQTLAKVGRDFGSRLTFRGTRGSKMTHSRPRRNVRDPRQLRSLP